MQQNLVPGSPHSPRFRGTLSKDMRQWLLDTDIDFRYNAHVVLAARDWTSFALIMGGRRSQLTVKREVKECHTCTQVNWFEST